MSDAGLELLRRGTSAIRRQAWWWGGGIIVLTVAGWAIGVLSVGYVASYLLPLVASLEDLRRASPWYWALGTQPVTDGVAVSGLGVLLAVTGALVTGTLAIERRDLRTP